MRQVWILDCEVITEPAPATCSLACEIIAFSEGARAALDAIDSRLSAALLGTQIVRDLSNPYWSWIKAGEELVPVVRIPPSVATSLTPHHRIPSGEL